MLSVMVLWRGAGELERLGFLDILKAAWVFEIEVCDLVRFQCRTGKVRMMSWSEKIGFFLGWIYCLLIRNTSQDSFKAF